MIVHNEGQNAALQLQDWIESGKLASRYDPAADVAPYYRKQDFAAGILPVARGMLEMARVDMTGEYTREMDAEWCRNYPRSPDITEPSRMVVVLNRHSPLGRRPRNESDFHPAGWLGLKGVTLEVGSGREPHSTYGQLGLILPYRPRNPKDANLHAHTVVSVALSGHTNARTYVPEFFEGGHLRYSLGMIRLQDAVTFPSHSDSSLESGTGIPGATSYLAEALPRLGEYFTDLASCIRDSRC